MLLGIQNYHGTKRSLYVVFAFKRRGTGSELPPEHPTTLLTEPVQEILSMLARQFDASQNIADYQLLDWELRPIGPRSTFASVPEPGVVFAVNAATTEEAIRLGTTSKMSSMHSGALLLFIQNGPGTDEHKGLTSRILDTIKTKLGLFKTSKR